MSHEHKWENAGANRIICSERGCSETPWAVIIALTAERAQYKEANQTMHDAFMEVRAKLNAWDTPHAPSTEAIVACVSRHLHELVAERDQLIEELAGCHCGRSMVHKACVAERDKLLEDIKDRDRTYLAVQRAEGLERDRLAAALEETAARLEAHQHIMCSDCVASDLDAEAWE